MSSIEYQQKLLRACSLGGNEGVRWIDARAEDEKINICPAPEADEIVKAVRLDVGRGRATKRDVARRVAA